MSKPKGMTLNYSMVTNEDGQQEIGFHYNDTDGIDVNRHVTGKDTEDIFTKLYHDVVNEITKQANAISQKKKMEAAQKQKAENNKKEAVNARIAELEARLKELETNNKSLKIDNEILNRRIKDYLQDQRKEPAQDFKNSKKEFSKPASEKYDPYEILNNLFSELGW